MKKIAMTLMSLSLIFSVLSFVAGTKSGEAKADTYIENEIESVSVVETTASQETTIETETTTEKTENTTQLETTTVATTKKKTEEKTSAYAKTKEEATSIKWETETKTEKNNSSDKTVVTTTAEVITPDGKNLGKFKITVYTPSSDGGVWGYQTATGVKSQHLKTCAVDPRVIPLGSTIRIGNLTLLACDTGSAVKGNVVDIFYDGSSSAACKWVSNFGTNHNVYLVK